MASQIKGSRHGDLWRQFQLLVGALSGDARFAAAREHLALPILGSFLWDPATTATLNDAELTNHDFLEALRDLAFTRQGKVLRPVDYKNLGAEELGGVYKSLLALTPQISADGARFTFAEFAGNERKTSGSYYTPDSLVQCLLDSALDPVVDEAIKGKTGAAAEKAILALKVCDPSVGSGHFLVGAAHRLARHLARVRALAQGESEPSPLLYQHALRDVIGHCLYGVDVNPMATELCRVSLWLEALDPGKPLSFLDHHIRVGNSLLGTTPALITAGLPDDTFTAIEGDDKKACTLLRKRNKAERKGLGPLFAQQDAEAQARLQQTAAAMEELPDDRPEDIRAKELALRLHEDTAEYRDKKQLADAWCAAFVIRKHFREPGRASTASGITQGHLNDLASGQPLPPELGAEVDRLLHQYQFFHWHLAFPEVFANGGFDCVLGNPPWENLQTDPQEFFAGSAGLIAEAANMAERNRLIHDLKLSNPELHDCWIERQRVSGAARHFLRSSQRYPLSTYGRLNTYGLFAELGNTSLGSRGRCGLILPVGIATDAFNQFFFSNLVKRGRLVSLYGFENEELVFPQVHHSFKFALVTVGSDGTSNAPELAFFLRSVTDLSNPDLRYRLARIDFELINPNTITCPVFRSRRDAEITASIYRRWPVILREDPPFNPWGVKCQLMFMMNTVTELTFTRELLAPKGINVTSENAWSLEGLFPLVEGKMFHQFDHRFGTYEGQTEAQANQGKLPEFSSVEHADPFSRTLPRYWLKQHDVQDALGDFAQPRWMLSSRDVTSSVVLRTVILAVLPPSATNDSAPLVHLPHKSAKEVCSFIACLNSLPLDFVARQKLGGNHLRFFTFFQLPVVTPEAFTFPCDWHPPVPLLDWLLHRVLELTYTAWDLELFAQDCGWSGPPFHWNEDRRFLLRCELDAAFFHLYLPAEQNGDWRRAEVEVAEDMARLKANFPIPRDAVAYIMDTFPVVRRKDEEKYDGDYRTKCVILEIYDAMQDSIRTGQPYQTRLNPAPGPPIDVLPDWKPGQPKPADWPSHIHPPRGCRATPTDEWHLSDLVDGAALPQSFKLVLEGQEVGTGMDSQWKCKVIFDGDGLPAPDTWVLVRNPNLQRGNTVIPVALGKLTYQELTDATTKDKVMVVTLRGPVPPAQVRIPLSEWQSFRPLAVLEPLDS